MTALGHKAPAATYLCEVVCLDATMNQGQPQVPGVHHIGTVVAHLCASVMFLFNQTCQSSAAWLCTVAARSQHQQLFQ